ncbi:hypothetical protein FB563_6638 [Streptomyces puniciscabiei]|uniref:Uncharacterized protein n=1 Tax=Streptomyces puniciscabiei TaxID=164348 RepID=A0A542TI24_9ACTN|nr:hypothetical protein FB563_6638 [Streptomyces puniciscabiei]
MVRGHTDLDPRPIGTIRQRRVGNIEQNHRATHVQDSPFVLGEARPSTKDDAVTVFPQFRGSNSAWPDVSRPGDVLIHGPLDMDGRIRRERAAMCSFCALLPLNVRTVGRGSEDSFGEHGTRKGVRDVVTVSRWKGSWMRRRDEESFHAFAAGRSGSLFHAVCVLCSGEVPTSVVAEPPVPAEAAAPLRVTLLNARRHLSPRGRGRRDAAVLGGGPQHRRSRGHPADTSRTTSPTRSGGSPVRVSRMCL